MHPCKLATLALMGKLSRLQQDYFIMILTNCMNVYGTCMMEKDLVERMEIAWCEAHVLQACLCLRMCTALLGGMLKPEDIK